MSSPFLHRQPGAKKGPVYRHRLPNEVIVSDNMCTFIHRNQEIIHIQLQQWELNYRLITAGVPLLFNIKRSTNLDALSQAKLAGNEVCHILHQAALISIEHKPTFLSVMQGRRVESKPNTNVNHLSRSFESLIGKDQHEQYTYHVGG